ncbi:MAG: hypothetical protein WA667_04695 [Candidatus Nitrosopolaris sp.]
MDPFKDCNRLYSHHFGVRMRERYLPDAQVSTALRDGEKIQKKKGEFIIRWNRWNLAVSIGNCILVLKTAYRD